VQTAEMKVQWCVSLTNIHSADELPTFSRPCIFSVSIDQLDKADAPLTLEAYEYLVSSTSCVVFVAKFWNLLSFGGNFASDVHFWALQLGSGTRHFAKRMAHVESGISRVVMSVPFHSLGTYVLVCPPNKVGYLGICFLG
jgi:hypothetical protein